MATKPHVLVVEDDPDIAELMKSFLEEDGLQVTVVHDGNAGLVAAQTKLPDLVLLDMTLPSLKGTEVCRELKQDPSTAHIPIIFVTGQTGETEVVLGLGLGSEDFIKKPFNGKELVARVHVALRRSKKTVPGKVNHLRHGGLFLDRAGFEGKWNDQVVPLTQSEFQILWLLVEQPGVVNSRDRLLHIVTDDTTVTDRTVDVHVANLRKKLGEGGKHLITVRGVGYKWID